MSKEMNLKFKWTQELFLLASMAAYDYESKKTSKKYIGWALIALAQIGVLLALRLGNIVPLFVATFLIIYWYWVRRVIRLNLAKRDFQSLKDEDKVFEIEVGKKGLSVNNNFIEWQGISMAISLKDGFLIYLGHQPLFIPAPVFKDIENKNRFASILKSHIENYQKI